MASLSSLKLLWFDELVTLHIARLGTLAAIWNALAHAADPNPPLTHLAVGACRSLFGEHEAALRLPAMLGYWLGMAGLFVFLRRRLPGTWALAGTLLSMTNAGFDFSFESRSYGIFYGLTMLAIFCWSRAVDPEEVTQRARAAALAGTIVALALAISANYFAVLAFMPVAVGELVRTWCRSRPFGRRLLIEWRIWIGLGSALTPLLIYRPLIERSVAQFAPYAFNRVSSRQIPGSYMEMVEYVLYPLLVLFGLALAVRVFARSAWFAAPRWLRGLIAREAGFGRSLLPAHETAAALTLTVYPFLGYIFAKAYGGMFSPRFVIPVCLGFAILGTATAFRLLGHLRHAGTIMLAFLLVWFVARESFVGYMYKEQKQAFYRVINAFPAQYKTGPIVISDPLMALTFQHYARAALASRVVYPIDFPAVRSFRGDDSPEENMWAARSTIYPMPLVPLDDLERHSSEYVILATDGNWLIEALKSQNKPIYRLPIDIRADGIGGFTPLAHGTPAFFVAGGDRGARATLPVLSRRLEASLRAKVN